MSNGIQKPLPTRKPPPAMDILWGKELKRTYPALFNIGTQYADIAQNNESLSVESGHLWTAIPHGGMVSLYNETKSRWCPGMLRDGHWEPLNAEPPVPEFAKIIFYHHPAPRISIGHLRPGMVLGEGYTARTPTLLAYKRAVFVHGTTSSNEHPSKLALSYKHRVGLPAIEGEHHFWKCWGISSIVRQELISFFADSRACQILRGGRPEETPHRASTRILGEVLGVIEARECWGKPSPRLWNNPQRGEIVKVHFPPDPKPIPCVVVSPDEFNKHWLNSTTVLRCIPYEECHDDLPTVIPIKCALDNIEGQWSIALPLIRGITKASQYVKRNTPPLLLPAIAPELAEDLNQRLEFFYA